MTWQIISTNDYFIDKVYYIDKNSFIYKYHYINDQIVVVNYKLNRLITSYGISIQIFNKI